MFRLFFENYWYNLVIAVKNTTDIFISVDRIERSFVM